MQENSDQAKVIALALYEIRLLLSGYLGSENDGDMPVRQAAHLAYALHNQALAVLDDKSFDVLDAIKALKFPDTLLGAEFTDKFDKMIGKDA
ncbi:hypothetical protein H8K35_10380 [Undibacterium sp. LX40W]|uniref:Uncharacterized protein n=1 Tax=Undibacterium nitidum TaxID=2762298 RepID=A0A923HP15_9BURK|nr:MULTISPECIES: hypothetical protein [Undibacterium]MBC3881938.1 hypothetical protein [Undibacterium nitidum]MBC3892065.1 hypothetical protein [Undibacterium sp. LX40W]